MNEENKSYQLTCLFSPLLEQKKIEEISQKLKKWIIEKGGSLSEKEKSLIGSKKSLAYPLKKYREAFYLNFNLLLAGQAINQLGQQLNSEKDILRYLIVAKKKLKAKPAKEAIDYKLVDKIEPLVAKEIPLPEKPVSSKAVPEKKTG
jgi:small subunit ribosomal protein S6